RAAHQAVARRPARRPERVKSSGCGRVKSSGCARLRGGGAAVGLSEASVTRFAYALGFTGFAELRERLQKELLQRNNRGFKDILDQSYRESPGAVPHLYDFLREDMELLEQIGRASGRERG